MSAFEELCKQRELVPEEWRKSLATPIIADKPLIDMTDEELAEHYRKVEERAENTQEDRALLVLERTQEGRLERQANKVFGQQVKSGSLVSGQVQAMLEALRYELTSNEVHYILQKFNAVDGPDTRSDVELTQQQWLWLVGATQILKESYKHVPKEDWEAAYAAEISHAAPATQDEDDSSREAAASASAESKKKKKGEPGWWWTAGEKAALAKPLAAFAWGMQPEVEADLLNQMALFVDGQLQDIQPSME